MGMGLGTPCCDCGQVIAEWRVTVAFVTHDETYHEELIPGDSNGFTFSMTFEDALLGTFLRSISLERVSGNDWKVTFQGKTNGAGAGFALFTHDFATGQSPDITVGTATTCIPTQAIITIQDNALERADDFTWIPRITPTTLTAYRRKTFTRVSGSSFLTTRHGPMTLYHSEDATYDYWTGEYAQPHDGATPVHFSLRCDQNGDNFQYQLNAGGAWSSLNIHPLSLKPFALRIGSGSFVGGEELNSVQIYDPADIYPYNVYQLTLLEIEGVLLETEDIFDTGNWYILEAKSLKWSCLAGESIFDTTAVEAAIASHFGVTGVSMTNQTLLAQVYNNDAELLFQYIGDFTSSGGAGRVNGFEIITAAEGAFSAVVTLEDDSENPIGATVEYTGSYGNVSNPRECFP